ncbi:MAG TPA: Trm112 family protein [Allosphingosinicella sp.]
MNAALLDLLVCPVTRTPLRYDEAAQELVSDAAGIAYPVRDGVPVMLVEEARRIAD